MFIVQERVHADRVSRHETREEAVAAIEEMVRIGLAEPGEYNIREVDRRGKTVHVFGVTDSAARVTAQAPVLTQREREVLQLLAKGLSNADIAARLFVSQETVKVHIRHAITKLEAETRAEALETARKRSLIS
jgi:DNA-binding NarL/FixJ family response regulator